MITNPNIESYLERLSEEKDPVIFEMERYAESIGFPIIGPLVGQFLRTLVQLNGAKRILECGGGYGYSALWMAPALPNDGHIISIDYSSDNSERGRTFLNEAGYGDRVTFLSGDVMQLTPNLEGEFDLILNDVDKHFYPVLLPIMLKKLRPNGLLVSDNVLWHGRVLDEDPDETTKAVMEYNRLLYNTPYLETTIVPLRDGIALSIKKD